MSQPPFSPLPPAPWSWRLQMGFPPGASTQARITRFIFCSISGSPRCTAPKSRSLALSPCTWGDRYRQHSSVQGAGSSRLTHAWGPERSWSWHLGYSHLPAQTKQLHPQLQSCRQDRQPSRHPCLREGGLNQSTQGMTVSTSTKQCEDKGKPTLEVSVNIH